jgi:putative ABC transport system permease protein
MFRSYSKDIFITWNTNKGKVNFLLSHSIKEMTFFKVRYLLIIFILFFISALVFIINGLANGLSMDNASSIKNIQVTSFFLERDANNRLDRSKITMANLDKSVFDENLQALSISMTSMGVENTDKEIDVTLMSINPSSFLEPKVDEGKGLNKKALNTVILNQSLMEEGIKIGSKLKDEKSGVWLKVIGFTSNQTFSHTPVAYISFETWEEMTGENGEPYYSSLVLKKNNSNIINKISDTVEGGVWVEKDQVVKGIPGYEAEQNSLFMMLAFLIFIAVFVLAAFFYIMTIQKTNQFGILKAIGAKTAFLIQSTLLQVTILTIVSLVAAIGFTWAIVLILPEDIPFLFDSVEILKFSGVICLVSIFGSLLSTYNIVQADPIQAMGRIE